MIFLVATEVVNTVSNEPTSITSLGVPAIFVLLVLREVFAYSKGKKVINGYQKAATCNEIVKRFDMSFAAQDRRFDKVDTQLDEVKTLIKTGSK